MSSTNTSIRFALYGRAMDTHNAHDRAVRMVAKDAGVLVEDPGNRVADFLQTLDVFLLTAGPRSEGISTTVLEAMATGIPVVTTDVGALREAVENGTTGIVVAAVDVSALSQAVSRLARDPRLRQSMSKESRTRAVRLFDLERCVDVHLHAYEYAINRGRRRSRSAAA